VVLVWWSWSGGPGPVLVWLSWFSPGLVVLVWWSWSGVLVWEVVLGRWPQNGFITGHSLCHPWPQAASAFLGLSKLFNLMEVFHQITGACIVVIRKWKTWSSLKSVSRVHTAHHAYTTTFFKGHNRKLSATCP
jgi:hypothetical protein